jgi:hypothetical protein
MAVERRRRVHDVRTSAESTPPEAVREHDLIAVTLRVAFHQRATECHRDAQHVEVVRGDSRALDPFRIAETGPIRGDRHHGGCRGLHDREDRRRRADAERQGQDRHTGERGLPSQEPPRMT